MAGAYFTIDAAQRERQQSIESQRDLGRLHSDNAALHADNTGLKNQNLALQNKADATYEVAVRLNNESVQILSGVNQSLATSRKSLRTTIAVGGDARVIASRANRLQISAADSLRGIERLESPLSNLTVEYEVDVAIEDSVLRGLKATLLAAGAKYQQQVAAAKPQNGILNVPFPEFRVTDVLNSLPPLDPGSSLLRSMDLAIEMYRPPFPRPPYYGNAHKARIIGASDSVDFLMRTHDLTDRYIQLAWPVKRPPDLDVTVAAWFVTAHIARSGRLDSIVDIPGSMILIHLIPDIFAFNTPGLLKSARLQGVVMDINGTLHRINLAKAKYVQDAVFPYYEIHVPTNWRPASYSIP